MDPLDICYFLSAGRDYQEQPPTEESEFHDRCYHQLDELQRLLHLIHRKQAIRFDQYRRSVGHRPCLQLTDLLLRQSFSQPKVARAISTSIVMIFQGVMSIDYPDWVTVYPEFLTPTVLTPSPVVSDTRVNNYTTNPLLEQTTDIQATPIPTTESVSVPIPNVDITITKCRRRVLGHRPILRRQGMV